jgi:ribosomal protein L30E
VAKKLVDEKVQEVKAATDSGRALFGVKETLKSLNKGKIEKVFLAKNTPQDIKEDLEHYCKVAGVEVVVLEQDNEEIGVLVKKNFFVSVIGLAKA